MRATDDWPVGGQVFVVRDTYRHKAGIYLTITKVGRKWVYLGKEEYQQDRFDPETMELDGYGYSSPGKVYESEQDFEEQDEAHRVWGEFRQCLARTPPKGLTAARIREIADEWNLPINGELDGQKKTGA